jgi:hypothetical protein
MKTYTIPIVNALIEYIGNTEKNYGRTGKLKKTPAKAIQLLKSGRNLTIEQIEDIQKIVGDIIILLDYWELLNDVYFYVPMKYWEKIYAPEEKLSDEEQHAIKDKPEEFEPFRRYEAPVIQMMVERIKRINKNEKWSAIAIDMLERSTIFSLKQLKVIGNALGGIPRDVFVRAKGDTPEDDRWYIHSKHYVKQNDII